MNGPASLPWLFVARHVRSVRLGPGAIARTARRVRSALVPDRAGRAALPDVEIRDLAIYERLGSAREGETEIAPPVFLGPPGVGKSHLAVGLGLKAIERGYRVLFATAAGLITALLIG